MHRHVFPPPTSMYCGFVTTLLLAALPAAAGTDEPAEFSAGIKDRIRVQLEDGGYRSEEEVLLAAIDALEAQKRCEGRHQQPEELIIERAIREAGLRRLEWLWDADDSEQQSGGRSGDLFAKDKVFVLAFLVAGIEVVESFVNLVEAGVHCLFKRVSPLLEWKEQSRDFPEVFFVKRHWVRVPEDGRHGHVGRHSRAFLSSLCSASAHAG